jgi:hypothetical protein
MPIVRAERPKANFTIVQNTVIRDHRLSFRARGILVFILSMPDNWSTSSDHLGRISKEGRDAVRVAMKELQSAGYIQRIRQQTTRGHWQTVTIVHDNPVDNPVDKWGIYPLPKTDFQASVNQSLIEELTTNDSVSSSSTTLSSQECGFCKSKGTLELGEGTIVNCPECHA